MKRVSDLEQEHLKFRRHDRFVNISIVSTTTGGGLKASLDSDLQRRLKKIRTDFDTFDADEIRALVAHGYGVAHEAFMGESVRAELDIPSREMAPWDPFPSQTTPPLRRWLKRIERGRRRRFALWNSSDFMSWGLASACLVAVLLPGVPVYVANLRVQQEAVQVARQKALINEQLSASGARVRVDIVTTRLDGDKGERGVTGGALAFVSIPRDHRLGIVEAPTLWTFYKEDPSKHIVVSALARSQREEVVSRILSDQKKSEMVLAFVPGRATDFNNGLRRAAVLTYDLGFNGRTLWSLGVRIR